MYTCMLKAAIVLFTTTEHAIHSNFISTVFKTKAYKFRQLSLQHAYVYTSF